MLDGRLGRGDSLPVARAVAFRLADSLGDLVGGGVDLDQLRLDPLGLGPGGVTSVVERLQFALELSQPIAQLLPVDQAHLSAQLLEAVGVFFIAAGFAGLGADAAEPGLNLVDNVGQPQQVLLDPFQPPQGFDLADLESADAGRLLENHPPIPRRGLQKHVHLALLDDAVGLGAHARARQQVANIAEPGGVAVDQVLAFAAAIDAAGNVDLGGVDPEQVFGVVERERDFGGIGGPTVARAVEDHVGHLPAAKALHALLAQHPLDGIDDVRLARAVRSHHHRDPRGKLKPGPVGETLETDEFEGLQHGGMVSEGKKFAR